jgi:hypothetical protein
MNKIPFYFDSLYSDKHEISINGFSREFIEAEMFDSLKNVSFTNYITFLKDPMLENDPYFKLYNEKKDEKYFYPIFWPQVENFELNNNLTFPEKVLYDIRNKRAKILLINAYEGYSMDSFYNDANHIAKKHNIDTNQIVFLNGNLKILNDENHVYVNFWECISEHYHYNFRELTENLVKDICNQKIRKHKFICLQRRPHPHRIAMFTDLYSNRNDGILTLGTGDNDDLEYFKGNSRKFYRNFPDKITVFNEIRHVLPYEYDVKLQTNNPTHDNEIEKFTDSYLHVVAETYFFNRNNRLFFSEKIFKPVVFMQPFVLFSETGSLQAFRNMGFKTFPTIIDESYDEIIDDRQRYDMAMQSVKNFISQDIQQIHNQVRSILPDLMYNYGLLHGRRVMHSAEVYSKLFSILYNS